MEARKIFSRISNAFVEIIVILILLAVVIISAIQQISKAIKRRICRRVSTKEELQLLYALGEVCHDIRFLEIINGDGEFPIWRGRFVDAIGLEIYAREKARELVSLCREKGITQWKINAFTS